jgi:hypothetical protein
MGCRVNPLNLMLHSKVSYFIKIKLLLAKKRFNFDYQIIALPVSD